MLNATELRQGLGQFYGTERYHRLTLGNAILATDGVAWLAQNAECFWLVDEIAWGQLDRKVNREEFQVWNLKVQDRSAVLTCENGNGRTVFTKEITYTDFPLNEITLWVEIGGDPDGNITRVILLPSEH